MTTHMTQNCRRETSNDTTPKGDTKLGGTGERLLLLLGHGTEDNLVAPFIHLEVWVKFIGPEVMVAVHVQ